MLKSRPFSFAFSIFAASFILAIPLASRGKASPAPTFQLWAVRDLSALNALSDRENDGLVGPVRRVKTETAKITVNKNGQIVEGARVVIETASYDLKGNKTDNAYYLAAGAALTGKEVYKHDARGNVTEMVVYNNDGSVLSKEVYTYEYDAVGNWTKMTTSVAVVENGKISFEPTEVTYRTITYYLEESVAKTMQPASGGASAQKPSAAPSTVKAASPVAPLANSSMQLKLDKAALALAANSDANNAGGKNNSLVKIDDADAPARKNGDGALKPLLRPVSGGVLNGKAKSLPAPVYPAIARRARISGTVTVEVLIDVSGKVISAQATSGPMMLRQAAEAAARLATFEPTTLSGQPVKVSGTINYTFMDK
jgi:TonB family protein